MTIKKKGTSEKIDIVVNEQELDKLLKLAEKSTTSDHKVVKQSKKSNQK